VTIEEIKNNILTQDDRCTSYPIYLVQALDRISPIEMGAGDGVMYHDWQETETYYPESDRWKELTELDKSAEGLPAEVTKAEFNNLWVTIQPFFTEAGANAFLERQAHNLRRYHGTRVYVDSLYRNDEMRLIRDFIINQDSSLSTWRYEQKETHHLL